MSAQASGFRSGFVGLIGRPNVGKSTILNYYLGEKVAITTPTPQTTRHRILGILTQDAGQVMFVDTPGLHEPQHALGRSMIEVAKAVIDEVDVLVVVVDARHGLQDEDERVLSRVRQALRRDRAGKSGLVALLAVNKVDLVKKPRLLPLLEACARPGLFADCIPVSAKTGEQMDVLLDRIVTHLPEGPQWYGPEERTDQTQRQRIGELIREQIILATRQEVPGAVAVALEAIEERERLMAIRATIYVERPGQKAIIIGHGGLMLKRIGQAARQELERLVGRKVFLELWVKVVKAWRSDERLLRELGYL
jgi:GTP-binding protein Era